MTAPPNAPLLTYTGPAGESYTDSKGRTQTTVQDQPRFDYAATPNPDGSYPYLGLLLSAADKAVYTDPSAFNDFSSGTFIVEYSAPTGMRSVSLSRDGAWFLWRENGDSDKTLRVHDGSNALTVTAAATITVAALSWSGSQFHVSVNGEATVDSPWIGTWGSGDLQLALTGFPQHLKRIRFDPKGYAGTDLQALSVAQPDVQPAAPALGTLYTFSSTNPAGVPLMLSNNTQLTSK